MENKKIRLGSRIKINDEEYILAMVDYGSVNLISLVTGNRASVSASWNNWNVPLKILEELTDGLKYEIIKELELSE